MATQAPRLEKKVFIEGEIAARTGLHIGGPPTGYAAGAADALVIRDPVQGRPYVPGSALRGKLRHLLEAGFGAEAAEQLFGGRRRGKGGRFTPGRLIVRDGALRNADWLDGRPGLDLPGTELKSEAAVDRLNAGLSPRQIERVPAGAHFELKLVLDVFEGDDGAALVASIFNALALLEEDYLGAHGARGYGQVSISVASVTEKDRDIYIAGGDARPSEVEVPERLRAS